MSREARIACWEDTRQQTASRPPPPHSSKYKWIPAFSFKKQWSSTHIEVVDSDTIDCGLAWVARGYNPLVLNLASDAHPGGGVERGAAAQEESLFRRTNYWQTLRRRMYPLERYEAVYSPGITVIKTAEQDGWKPLPQPEPRLDFIACPAIRHPHLTAGRLNAKEEADYKKKIELILQVAALKGHDCVIFGAMGCGAWGNPPEHIAEIFKEILEAHKGVIKAAVFAVLNLSAAAYGNYAARSASNYDVFKRILE